MKTLPISSFYQIAFISQTQENEKMSKGGVGKSRLAIVHVVIVEARGLMAMDGGKTSDPYCKVKLGQEKHKTKTINGTVNPNWRKAFDFYWKDESDHVLEFSVRDDMKSEDDLLGRAKIDLHSLKHENTHNLWKPLEEGTGELNVLVTISATTRGDSPSNLLNLETELVTKKSQWIKKYVSLLQIFLQFKKTS